MNAIIHRDYSSVVETYIRVHPTYVEISNPGNLPPGWTEDDLFKKHDSEPANRNIANAFFDMGYIERFGSGLELIKNECEAMNIPLPEYSVGPNRVEIVFRLPEKKDTPVKLPAGTSGLTDMESKVYAMICEREDITSIEMSELTGIPERTLFRTISKLTEKGYIQRIGSRKTGKWIPVLGSSTHQK